MGIRATFEGVYPILVTPFDESGGLDIDSFDRIIRFMADLGVEGVTILGVLGEANRMLDAEREQLIKAGVFAADDRIPVVVGTSHSGTDAAGRLSRISEDLGASGVMVAPSREAVPNADRVLEYFQRVGEATRLPIVMQDHPASTQVHMPVPLMLRIIHEVDTVACVKEEAVPTAPKISALMEGMERPVPILTGLGALYGAFDLARGSHGFMTGFAFPEVLMAMVREAREGRQDAVMDIYRRFLPLIVFEQQPGVAVRKEIYRLRGLIAASHVRHPARGIDLKTADQLRAVLDAVLPGVDITKPIEV